MANNTYGFDFLKQEHTQAGLATAEDDSSSHTSPQKVSFADHVEADEITAEGEPSSTAERRDRSDLEKQFEVIQFLQTHRSSGRCFTPAAIYDATGIDLSEGGDDENVAAMLARNPKVRIEEILNPDYNEDFNADEEEDEPGKSSDKRTILAYGYQAKFNIHDKVGLLAQINRCKNGIRARDLHDAYEGVVEDINALVTGGDVVAVANSENKDRTLFPRGEPFLIELEGNVFLPDLVLPTDEQARPNNDSTEKDEEKKESSLASATSTITDPIKAREEQLRQQAKLELIKRKQFDHSHYIGTDIDARKQIRRGEAVWVGGQWFRVSSAVREGVPLSEQPPRAQAPPSVTLRKELSKKNEVEGYVRPFTVDTLPLDAPLREDSKKNMQLAKEARAHLLALGVHSSGMSNASSAAIRKRPTKHLLPAHGGNSHSGVGGGMGASTAAASGLSMGGVTMEAVRKASSEPALVYSQARRHGCSTDIKEMFLATRADVPEDETELYKLLVSYKLLDEGEAMRRPRMKKKAETGQGGKPKKRRYYERKNQRITNVHLLGTEMGAVLAQAAARQQQGKEVGDGGM